MPEPIESRGLTDRSLDAGLVERSRLVLLGALWLAFAGTVVAASWPLLRARLGPIDDHEYARFLRGRRAGGSVLDLLTGLTEVGSWGESSRFRPLYYLLRVSGVWVLGENAPIRYAVRVGVMAVVCVVLGIAAARMIVELRGRPASRVTQHLLIAFGALLMLWLSSWIDILPRLGPSELLLMLGVALMMLGVALIGGTTTEMTWRSYSLICSGLFLAAGAKENGTLLAAAVVGIVLMYGVPRTPRLLGYGVLAAVMLWSGWIALGVWLGTRRTGSDIYETDRSQLSLMQNLVGALLRPEVHVVLIACGLIVLFVPTARARYVAAVLGFPLFAVFSDHVFYGDAYKSPLRYYVLVESMTYLIAYVASAMVLSHLVTSYTEHRLALRQRVYVGVGVGLLVVLTQSAVQIDRLHEASVNTREASEDWNSFVDSQVTLIRSTSATQVVIVVTSTDHYEMTYSFVQYLGYRLAGEEVSFFLAADRVQLSPSGEPANAAELADSLTSLSQYGDGVWNVRPIDEYAPTRNTVCYGILTFDTSVPLECDLKVGF